MILFPTPDSSYLFDLKINQASSGTSLPIQLLLAQLKTQVWPSSAPACCHFAIYFTRHLIYQHNVCARPLVFISIALPFATPCRLKSMRDLANLTILQLFSWSKFFAGFLFLYTWSWPVDHISVKLVRLSSFHSPVCTNDFNHLCCK